MTNDIATLEKEIELLTKKIELLKQVKQLEMQQPQPPLPPNWSPFISPQVQQPFYGAGCAQGFHDYPMPWFGTGMPPCRRCGHADLPYVVTSCTNTAPARGWVVN